MGAPFTTNRGYVRERVLEELYRRPGEYLSTQQLTALIDEADTSAEIASICFDLKRTQRLCTGQKVMGANGIPANTWGLSDGERAYMERRRPELAAMVAPKGKGKGQSAAKSAKSKVDKGAAPAEPVVKPDLTTAQHDQPFLAVAVADDELEAMGLPAAAPGDDPLPLPAESHEDERPAIALAKTGCGGHGGCGGHCANHERDSLRQQLDEQEIRLSDLAHAEAAAVELAGDLAAARDEVEVTQAALRESQENLKQVRAELGALLDGHANSVAEHNTRLRELAVECGQLNDELATKDRAIKDALTEIAALESFRDSFLGILEERDARLAEAQRRIDALMLAVQPNLGARRDPEQDDPSAKAERAAQRRIPEAGLAAAPSWHVNLASEPFNLPRVPKDWVGELSLRLLDEHDARLKFKIESEGAGAFCQFKADAVIDHSGADFVPGLANGLIQLMDYLFPHQACDWPPDTASQTATQNSHPQTTTGPAAGETTIAEAHP